MTRTERLERQSQRSRERVANLIDELRERVVPADMVDEFIDLSANGAARDFVRSLGQQVRSNPLPCVLIGAGLAWLILSERSRRPASQVRSAQTKAATAGRRRVRRRGGARRKRGGRRARAAA
jgi:hypothetical protein